jgi:hypothetical protein
MPVYLKLFPLFFFYELIIGIILSYTQEHGIHNSWIANASAILEFCFYFFILHEIIINAKVRRIILWGIYIFALLGFTNIFFIQKKIGFNPVNFTIGCFVIVVFCIYYFAELFQKAEVQSLSRLPAFWIASAILFNTVLVFPLFALIGFMEASTNSNSPSRIIFSNIGSIFNIISVLTNVLYSIAFLCRIRIRKSTL